MWLIISEGKASRWEGGGSIKLEESEWIELIASAVAVDSWGIGVKGLGDREVEGDLKSWMIVSILFLLFLFNRSCLIGS